MKTSIILRGLLCMPLVVLHSPAGAATPGLPSFSGASQELNRQQLERQKQEQKLLETPVQPQIDLPTGPGSRPALSDEKNIPVQRFEFGKSDILTKQELQQAVAPFTGRKLSLQELYDALDAVNRLYEARGMPTARAFLPPQEIRDGVVKIRLVEARVGETRIAPMQRLAPGFVDERLTLAPGELMSVPVLESDLVRFNRLHDVQLRASIGAGQAAGTTDIEITASEPSPISISMFVDNAGRYSLGQGRLGFIGTLAGPLKLGDNLDFSVTGTEGSRDYILAYAVPLTADDLKLEISYSNSEVDVIQGDFEPLDISGRSKDFSLGLSLPLKVTSSQYWAGNISLSARESTDRFGGVAQSDTDLGVWSLSVSGDIIGDRTRALLDLGVANGSGILGGEESFTLFRANAMYLWQPDNRWQFMLRGGAQYSPTRDLPGSEQFQIGGTYTVRGYSEGILSGRSGYYASAELRYPLNDPADSRMQSHGSPRFDVIAFLDHGRSFPYLPGGRQPGSDFRLTGAGSGLVFDFGRRINGRLAIAWPLNETRFEPDDKEPRLHAQLIVSLL